MFGGHQSVRQRGFEAAAPIRPDVPEARCDCLPVARPARDRQPGDDEDEWTHGRKQTTQRPKQRQPALAGGSIRCAGGQEPPRGRRTDQSSSLRSRNRRDHDAHAYRAADDGARAARVPKSLRDRRQNSHWENPALALLFVRPKSFRAGCALRHGGHRTHSRRRSLGQTRADVPVCHACDSISTEETKRKIQTSLALSPLQQGHA